MKMNPPKAASRDSSLAAHPVVKSFLSGSVSGFCSTVLFQPFDLVKTRLQEPAKQRTNQPMEPDALSTKSNLELHASNATPHPRSSGGGGSGVDRTSTSKLRMSSVFVAVVRQDGVLGLWSGLTPSLARTVPGVGLYFGFLHSLKSSFNLHHRKLTSEESFLLGATARVSAAGVLMPFTVIKARFESDLFNYRSVSHALLQISRLEGIKALWSGMVATILRDAPYSGLYLMFYTRAKDSAKQFLVKHSSSSYSSSASYSSYSSSASYSSYSSSASYSSTSSAPPSLLHRLLASLPMSSVYFLCSIAAGVLAAAATQPPDVIKTRMQLQPGLHRNVVACAVAVWRTEGVPGFFAGFVPRTLRRTLMAAATWTLYEHIMSWMGLT